MIGLSATAESQNKQQPRSFLSVVILAIININKYNTLICSKLVTNSYKIGTEQYEHERI